MRNYILSDKYQVKIKSGTDGYQPKYFRNNYWYKVDVVKGKGYLEHVISLLLRYSNLPSSAYVYYEACLINGKSGCRSCSFLKDSEYFISFDSLYSSYVGGDLQTDIHRLSTAELRYKFLLDLGMSICKLDFNEYFKTIFLLDLLIENIDRHTKNIGVIYNQKYKRFRYAPIFDNGRSLGISLSPSSKSYAQTISGSFVEQVTTSCGFPVRSILKLDYPRCLRDPDITRLTKLVSNLNTYEYIFKK